MAPQTTGDKHSPDNIMKNAKRHGLLWKWPTPGEEDEFDILPCDSDGWIDPGLVPQIVYEESETAPVDDFLVSYKGVTCPAAMLCGDWSIVGHGRPMFGSKIDGWQPKPQPKKQH